MTLTEFNKRSCELIEKIQELEIQALLAKYELYELKEQYNKQTKEEQQVINFKKFAEKHNQEIANRINKLSEQVKLINQLGE